MASLSLPEVENDFDHLDQLDTMKALPKIEVVLLLEFPNYQGTDSGHRRDSRRCLVISTRHRPHHHFYENNSLNYLAVSEFFCNFAT